MACYVTMQMKIKILVVLKQSNLLLCCYKISKFFVKKFKTDHSNIVLSQWGKETLKRTNLIKQGWESICYWKWLLSLSPHSKNFIRRLDLSSVRSFYHWHLFLGKWIWSTKRILGKSCFFIIRLFVKLLLSKTPLKLNPFCFDIEKANDQGLFEETWKLIKNYKE